jgi:hypothetical protein
MTRRLLLACGVLASLLYVGIDVLAALRYPGYHSFTSQAVSELMARGAPTERLVDPPMLLYSVLMLAFGIGVWKSSPPPRARVAGGLLIVSSALGLTGPTLYEMNLRGTGSFAADAPHIALTAVGIAFTLATLAVASKMRGRGFRLYSLATIAASVVFGALTALASGGIATGEPTPWVGILERIDIGSFLVWVAVFAVVLWSAGGATDAGRRVHA